LLNTGQLYALHHFRHGDSESFPNFIFAPYYIRDTPSVATERKEMIPSQIDMIFSTVSAASRPWLFFSNIQVIGRGKHAYSIEPIAPVLSLN